MIPFLFPLMSVSGCLTSVKYCVARSTSAVLCVIIVHSLPV